MKTKEEFDSLIDYLNSTLKLKRSKLAEIEKKFLELYFEKEGIEEGILSDLRLINNYTRARNDLEINKT